MAAKKCSSSDTFMKNGVLTVRQSIPADVVVEVRGGVVQGVYSKKKLKIILVDWDNIREGDGAVVMSREPFKNIDDETRNIILTSLNR